MSGERAVSGVLSRLYALAPRGARFGLEAMREACREEGDPQDAVPSVHVSGTNGKGSVCASLEAIGRAASIRTGLYTSPHLGKFAERIRIDGVPIADDALGEELTYVLDRYPELTFFEVATLAAFRAFARVGVRLAIVEVGLGGRLDATNVLTHPLATAVTTIGYDHTAILGSTIEEIAREKAGILKPAVPVVTGPLPRAAMGVVEARAVEIGAGPIWRVGQELTHERRGEHLVVRGPDGRSVVVTPSLRGAHQGDNAAIAVGLFWMLRTSPARVIVEDVAIARGVGSVQWPGRLEAVTIEHGELAGRYLLDGAHNEEGARALSAAIDSSSEPIEARALVFGAMADKAWGGMLHELLPRFPVRIYVEPVATGGGRPATSTASMLAFDPAATSALSAIDALGSARRHVGREGLVVVAGSLYLVGEVRSILLGAPRDPQVGL